jgi:hypothetical protein
LARRQCVDPHAAHRIGAKLVGSGAQARGVRAEPAARARTHARLALRTCVHIE